MAQTVRRLAKIDDETLFNLFDELKGAIDVPLQHESYSISDGVNVTPNNYRTEDARNRYSIKSASMNIPYEGSSFSISFTRFLQDRNNGTTQASAHYDEIAYDFHDQGGVWQSKTEIVLRILAIVDRYCPAVGIPQEVDDAAVIQSLIAGFGRSHEAMLSSLNAELVKSEKRRRDLDAEFAAREEERRRELDAAKLSLEEERRRLELQSHMAERRRTLNSLAEEVRKDANGTRLPSGAWMMRWSVFGASILLGGASTYLSIMNIDKINISAQSPETWTLILRSIIESIVAIGAFAYAAGWIKSFYQSDIEEARRLQRFKYDLNRASWIAEAILEVHHEAKGTLPEPWIEGVTRGLFEDPKNTRGEESGSQALAALLGYTASASFGPEGPKFVLNRRGTKKLAEVAKEDSK